MVRLSGQPVEMVLQIETSLVGSWLKGALDRHNGKDEVEWGSYQWRPSLVHLQAVLLRYVIGLRRAQQFA